MQTKDITDKSPPDGCPWTTGGDKRGAGAVRCGRPVTHRCDYATANTCERHKSSCCVRIDAIPSGIHLEGVHRTLTM